MPHINVLDLAVFPAMSRRHCAMARNLHGVKVLREDEIWSTAVKVWQELPSSKIANSFVLAKRIANKIVNSKGGNDFLSGVNGTIAAGVRGEFLETEDGNVRRDGTFISFQTIDKKKSDTPNPMLQTIGDEKLDTPLDAITCISI